MDSRSPRSRASSSLLIAWSLGGVLMVMAAAAVVALLLSSLGGGCGTGAVGSIVLGPPGSGQLVGATEYGGPGDPGSGVVGARGDNLLEHPDTYAELGGLTWDTATAMGGLPYMAPLRVTWGARSAIGYKRDFGLGGGPIDGLPRVIDLWWQFAASLGIPYENGMWSGPVRIERPPATGAGGVLGQAVSQGATLLPASSAPLAVKEIIAAGNEIVGRPYVYGGGHGLPLSEVAPAYDCSSSVEHLLYGARLLPVTYGGSSSELESFGLPGTGRWVTLYANPSHVFMYVAGLRWDTHNAAGAGDGSSGIGWHPLVRDSSGFVARHPAGL